MVKALKINSTIFVLICMVALCVFAGIFIIGNCYNVAHADAIGTYISDEVYSDNAPENLAELRLADDGQLEHWAEKLKMFDGRNYNKYF